MRLSTLFIAGSAVFVSANEVAIPTGSEIVPEWTGSTAQDLHREYNNIFRHGNRNAASHKWTTFLLDRAHQMTDEKLQYMFGGFCAVSGSPVNPTEYNRYRLNLDLVGGGKHTGFMQYCCWPCVCDTQDFIKIDTKTITTKDGARQYHFTVLGNPCDHPEELSKPFVQVRARMHSATDYARCPLRTISPHTNPLCCPAFRRAVDDHPSGRPGGAVRRGRHAHRSHSL